MTDNPEVLDGIVRHLQPMFEVKVLSFKGNALDQSSNLRSVFRVRRGLGSGPGESGHPRYLVVVVALEAMWDHDNFVTRAKRSCHLPELPIAGVVIVIRADQGPIGQVEAVHVFLIPGLPLMKSHIARILSFAVCWIVALTASAVATEKNPPGDIPDDQVFVPYTSAAGGYSLKVPEGWARSEKGSDVGFIDKFDGVAVIVDPVATAPTTKDIVAKLEKSERGFKAVSAKEIRLPAGPAFLIKYECESEANPVTNKRIRLEDEAYVFYKNGKLAILTVWAPIGADNADQWKLISESFRW